MALAESGERAKTLRQSGLFVVGFRDLLGRKFFIHGFICCQAPDSISP